MIDGDKAFSSSLSSGGMTGREFGSPGRDTGGEYPATAEYKYRAFASCCRDKAAGDELTAAVYRILNQFLARHAPKGTEPPRVFVDRTDLAVGGRGLRLLKQQGLTGVTALAYSPDGSTLISVDASSLRFWSVADPMHALSMGQLLESGNLDTLAIDPVGGHAVLGGISEYVFEASYSPSRVAASICDAVGSPISSAQWTQYVPDLPYNPPCGDFRAAS